jgi:hypothetical protein
MSFEPTLSLTSVSQVRQVKPRMEGERQGHEHSGESDCWRQNFEVTDSDLRSENQ